MKPKPLKEKQQFIFSQLKAGDKTVEQLRAAGRKRGYQWTERGMVSAIKQLSFRLVPEYGIQNIAEKDVGRGNVAIYRLTKMEHPI